MSFSTSLPLPSFLAAGLVCLPVPDIGGQPVSKVILFNAVASDVLATSAYARGESGYGRSLGNHPIRPFSHDRPFGSRLNQRFLGSDHRYFRSHDRHVYGKDRRHFGYEHRPFRSHDDRRFLGRDHRHFQGHDQHTFDHRQGLYPAPRPHFKGYVPRNAIVCYRSGSVLVCYGH